MARMLELLEFSPDPKGSFQERFSWTTSTLKKLLRTTPLDNAAERTRHENLLQLYLISMLTLDPRDSEAFFHLGKLARNRETALSAMRYGRDLGMEPEKLLELQAVADKFNY